MKLRGGWLALAALCCGVSAQAQVSGEFAELRAKDARIAAIGYQLATGNAPYCDNTTPATGLLLHDVRAYGKAEPLRRALGLTSDIGIQAVVPGSPAAKAGLAADQSLSAIAGQHLSAFASDDRKRWKRLDTIRAAMAASLRSTGKLPLEIAGAPLLIVGVPACTTRFEVGPLGKRAVADGQRVVIGEDFPGYTWPEELLAGVIAHELAHNVLGHRAWFDANGRKRKFVRLTEREADRLAPWLLANAGYKPSAALRFMQTWGPQHSGGILRKRTHEGWDERAEYIAAEVPLVETVLAETGSADWRAHFRREDLPNR